MKRYEHVIIFGIDGGGSFLREADTPNMDRIFANGAKTYRAYASKPSISAECWGSMLIGVSPAVHGLTNSIVSEKIYPTDSIYPSVYRRIREYYPDAVLGAFCDWSPIIHGIVESNVGVTTMSARDNDLIPHITDYIRKEKPTFLFIHSDSVDGAGHGNGYGTPAHLAQIHTVDGYIGEVYDAVREAGIADDTLFCVICDHGGTCDPREGGGFGGGHGGWSDGEKYITFAAAGHGVASGEIEEMNIRDTAAIVLYALGIPAPDFTLDGWTSQLPTGLFEEEVPEYVDISAETGAEPRVSKIHHTSELVK